MLGRALTSWAIPRPVLHRTPARTFMRLSLFITPMNDHHLALAAQVGCTDIVSRYPGAKFEDLKTVVDKAAAYGLKISVIERYLPHDKIVHNKPGRDKQIEDIKSLIVNMGKLGVEVLCYNWMPADDWSRTSVTVKERGGALVTEWDEAATTASGVVLSGQKLSSEVTPPEQLWDNLHYFLKQVIPVAEANNVVLALHPDDPPVPVLRGRPQIMYSVEAIERAMKLVPSPANGICFCKGTFAAAGVDIVPAIKRLAPYIKFVHFRNVVGSVPKFRESFQDNGDVDPVAAMVALRESGFRGVVRPDHVPTLDGETNDNPGYEMLGRLWAIGYLKGLMQSVTHPSAKL